MSKPGNSVRHPDKQRERADKRRAGVCINGPLPDVARKRDYSRPVARVTHGPVVRAGKCQRCLDVHAKSR